MDFCAEKSAKIIAWHRNYLVLVWIRFSGVEFDLILVLRSQFLEYLPETLYEHALEQLEAARLEKDGSIFSPYGKRLTIIYLFEAL